MLKIGELVGGHYEITEHLGAGSFGTTYLAIDRHSQFQATVVVKHFHPKDPLENTLLEKLRGDFQKEADLLKKLGDKHRCVPQLIGFVVGNNELYIIQEFIEGNDLSDEIVVGKPLPEAEVKSTIEEILSALKILHDENIIHRDIKPANIRRRRGNKRLVLLDFGTAKYQQLAATVTPGTIIGTLGYMPEEQAAGNANLASDVYAVGVIGLSALTGNNLADLPRDDNTGEIKRDSVNASPEFINFLDGALARNQKDRYQNAEIALKALNSLQTSNQPTNLPPTNNQSTNPTKNQPTNQTKNQPTNSPRSFSWPLLPIGLIFVIGIFGVAWLFWPHQKWKIYSNSQYGIQLKYPEGWQLEPLDPDSNRGDLVIIHPPEQRNKDCGDRVIINVLRTNIKAIENYKNQTIDRSRKNFTDLKLSDETTPTTRLGSLPAFRLKHQSRDRQCGLFETIDTGTIGNNLAYGIIARSKTGDNSGDNSKFFETVDRIIESVEIVKPNSP
jgi:eukaryotic-like serine/threonine-protein kinase